MNRLARQRVPIVAPTPDVTCDRVSAIMELDPPLDDPPGTPSTLGEIVDTAGYGVYTTERTRVATMLQDGSFDVSALNQERLTEILSNLHAIRNGDRIVIQPDSND